ncbi:MAG: glycosyltransferase family 4 protein [Rickettsiales bacterium]|jgi:glycosyltransferase involved in cell wall biosynthesis|nr:glycosyltransferase family 4 protein [Rickettsiales bacterium]
MSKNILQVVPNLNSGGVEGCVVTLNKYLVGKNYKSFVLTTEGKSAYRITQDGGNIIKLNIATKNIFIMFINIFRIKNIIIKNHIDLVDVVSRAPAWSVYFACKMTKCPFVTTMHGNYSTGNFPMSFLKKFYNSSMIRGDYVVCVSDYIKNHALKKYSLFKKKYYDGKVVVVPRGVDTDMFSMDNLTQNRIKNVIDKLSLPDDRQIILLPGRFTDWKGQLYFLDVLKKVKNSNYLCLMLGKTENHKNYIEQISRKIRKYKLDNFVSIRDSIDDMPSVYSISSLVASSSIRGEAFGLVVVEAQSMERMVVATNIGGSSETIINNKTGFLVDVKDTTRFANIIDNILSMSLDEKMKFGKNARKHIIERYTTSQMCSNTIDIYKKAINGELI